MTAPQRIDLAVFRIVIAGLLLVSPEVHRAPMYAAVPLLGQAARLGLCAGALMGLLGLRPRLGLGLAALCGTWLLGLPHGAGAGVHNHHLVWFAALLAASPCGDALTAARRRHPPRPAVAYSQPLWAAWAILAAIYFWPGVWKLIVSGGDWLTGEVLLSHVYWKQAQSWTFGPLIALEQAPALLTAGAAATIALEVGAPLLILTGRGRWILLGGALAFHGLTAATLDIRFGSLWPCLAVLVPWHRWVRASARPEDSTAPARGPHRAATAGSVALVAAVWIAGARGESRGWPLACYPTFATAARPTMPTLLAVVDGRPVLLQSYAEPSPTLWAEVWRLIGIGGPVDPPALARFWRRYHPDAAGEVRFYRAEMAVRRARIDPAPRRIALLHTARFGPDTTR